MNADDNRSQAVLINNNRYFSSKFFRPKPTAPPEPIKEAKEPTKEPKKEQTKNVSFKNHLDYTSPPSSKPVLEKDQLAKLPYGWTAEVRNSHFTLTVLTI